MGERVIEVEELRKSYGDVEAVAGIGFHVDRGEVFAFLGPNGAGKTTTTEILEGYRTRSGGTVSVLGFDPAERSPEFRRRIGIVLQSTGIDPYLTVHETVEMYSGYYEHPRDVDEVIDLVGLAEKRTTRVNKLSGGQQRRLDVAIALAGDPELLFLDEPTTGFDPSARRNAWEIVKNLTRSARRCSSPPTSWTRRSTWPIAPPSSRRGGSSPRVRRTSWPAVTGAEVGSGSVCPPGRPRSHRGGRRRSRTASSWTPRTPSGPCTS